MHFEGGADRSAGMMVAWNVPDPGLDLQFWDGGR